MGHRCDAKGLQGVSGHPPRLKMQPKLSQNGTKNDTKTLLCFREPSKLGAYVPQGPPVTQGGLQRHTATTSRGRNSPLATWIRLRGCEEPLLAVSKALPSAKQRVNPQKQLYNALIGGLRCRRRPSVWGGSWNLLGPIFPSKHGLKNKS